MSLDLATTGLGCIRHARIWRPGPSRLSNEAQRAVRLRWHDGSESDVDSEDIDTADAVVNGVDVLTSVQGIADLSPMVAPRRPGIAACAPSCRPPGSEELTEDVRP